MEAILGQTHGHYSRLRCARVQMDGGGLRQNDPGRSVNADCAAVGAMSCGVPEKDQWTSQRHGDWRRSLGFWNIPVQGCEGRLSGGLGQAGKVRSACLDRTAGLAVTYVHDDAVVGRNREWGGPCVWTHTLKFFFFLS